MADYSKHFTPEFIANLDTDLPKMIATIRENPVADAAFKQCEKHGLSNEVALAMICVSLYAVIDDVFGKPWGKRHVRH